MSMMDKDKAFERMIWDAYHDEGNYEKLKFQIINVRNIMLRHKYFKKASIKTQYDMSITIGCIALQESRLTMNGIEVLTKKDQEKKFPFSISQGYKEPETIELSKQKLL